jgi:hypothetical protein
VSASHKLEDRLVAAAQVAGVLATAWFVWVSAILPRLGLQSVASIVAEALFYVTLAWIGGGIVTFWVYFVVALADLPRAVRFSWRTSAPAMWFAPAIVLLSAPIAPAFAVSLFLVANATRQLISQWGVVESPVHGPGPIHADAAVMFRTAPPDSAFLSWRSAPVLIGASTAQAGFVALLWSHQFGAAVLFAVSTAILTSLSISTGAYRPGKPPGLPHSALSVVWTFLLAAALTTGAVAVRGRGGAGAGAASNTADPGSGQSGTQAAKQAEARNNDNSGFGGDFPGVILLPPLQPHTTLVAPVPAPSRTFGAPLHAPRSIPFSGEYWMFRWPATRPPRGAVIRRGSASDLSFHTTDGWPMAMEAHQKLDSPMDINCCSQVQLAIQNSDPFPGTVSLELILIDTGSANPPHILGTAVPGPPSSTWQVLSFPIPPGAALRRFDEIKVVFHRSPVRADKSAKIAIERFALLP